MRSVAAKSLGGCGDIAAHDSAGGQLGLRFVNRGTPSLDQVHFYHPLACPNPEEPRISVRGKTGGAFDTVASFQWTTAVQGLAVLLLRSFCHAREGSDSEHSFAMLSGGKGSLALSLDYSLDKSTRWLQDMFGVDSKGRLIARRLMRRTNPSCRRPGPVSLSLNRDFLNLAAIRVWLDGQEVNEISEGVWLLRLVEKQCGAVEAEKLLSVDRAQVTRAGSAQSSHAPSLLGSFRRISVADPPVLGGVWKVGPLKALVTLFNHIDQFAHAAEVVVRLQRSCPAGQFRTGLPRVDCDCGLQAQAAESLVRSQGGIVVDILPDGSDCDNRPCPEHLFAAEAELVAALLRELKVHRVSMLSNNQHKADALARTGFSVTRRALPLPIVPAAFRSIYGEPELRREFLNHPDIEGAPFVTILSPECQNPLQSGDSIWLIHPHDIFWEDNVYYEDFLRRFLDRVLEHRPDLLRSQVVQLIDERGRENLLAYGLGPKSFREALRQTAISLFGREEKESMQGVLEFLDSFESELQRLKLAIEPGSCECLSDLRSHGSYLVMICQGDLWFECLKLYRSGLARYFDGIVFHNLFNETAYQDLISRFKVSPKQFRVLGSSLDLEMRSAERCGIAQLYYFKNPNRSEIVNLFGSQVRGLRSVAALTELRALVLRDAQEKGCSVSAENA